MRQSGEHAAQASVHDRAAGAGPEWPVNLQQAVAAPVAAGGVPADPAIDARPINCADPGKASTVDRDDLGCLRRSDGRVHPERAPPPSSSPLRPCPAPTLVEHDQAPLDAEQIQEYASAPLTGASEPSDRNDHEDSSIDAPPTPASMFLMDALRDQARFWFHLISWPKTQRTTAARVPRSMVGPAGLLLGPPGPGRPGRREDEVD